MARLSGSKAVAGVPSDTRKDFREIMREQDAWVSEKVEAARNLPEGEYVGRLVRFPFADGYALYLITGYDPSLHPTEQLELTWVDYGDGWGAAPATIRGFIPEDLTPANTLTSRLFGG